MYLKKEELYGRVKILTTINDCKEWRELLEPLTDDEFNEVTSLSDIPVKIIGMNKLVSKLPPKYIDISMTKGIVSLDKPIPSRNYWQICIKEKKEKK